MKKLAPCRGSGPGAAGSISGLDGSRSAGYGSGHCCADAACVLAVVLEAPDAMLGPLIAPTPSAAARAARAANTDPERHGRTSLSEHVLPKIMRPLRASFRCVWPSRPPQAGRRISSVRLYSVLGAQA